MWCLGFGGVSRNHLEGFAQRVIASSSLLVPLRLRSSIRSLWLNTRRCWCSERILDCLLDTLCTGIDLRKPCVGDGRVGDNFGGFGLGRSGLGLCDIIYPRLFCRKWSFVKRGLLNLGV
jgi:hypothetical protein